MKTPPEVILFVGTYGCPDAFHRLTFKTLRVGFPNAVVTVLDCSDAAGAAEFKRLAVECDCVYAKGKKTLPIWATENLLNPKATLDNDRIFLVASGTTFHESVEDWRFGSLWAGLILPRYLNEDGLTTMHSGPDQGLIVINRPADLRKSLLSVPDGSYPPPEFFFGRSYFVEGQRLGQCHFGGLHHFIQAEQFTQRHLSAYSIPRAPYLFSPRKDDPDAITPDDLKGSWKALGRWVEHRRSLARAREVGLPMLN